MIALKQVRGVPAMVLPLGDRAAGMDRDTELLVRIPEFDSTTVVSIQGRSRIDSASKWAIMASRRKPARRWAH
ncbi:MAG: hypothetical protein ACLFS2_10495 [Halochromatium sp.]|uniref:hypothetical protein n=1 Tax=Halochromatium sp. TaxID=2049430 RepID=UPI00397B5808